MMIWPHSPKVGIGFGGRGGGVVPSTLPPAVALLLANTGSVVVLLTLAVLLKGPVPLICA